MDQPTNKTVDPNQLSYPHPVSTDGTCGAYIAFVHSKNVLSLIPGDELAGGGDAIS
jgi:hypothetical protein